MTETRSFTEYKEYIERLATWLNSTNANIREVLQSVNKQRALLIIKVTILFLTINRHDHCLFLEFR